MTSPRPLVLASSSSSRRAQLRRLGIEFQTADPDIDETPLQNENSRQLVTRLAEEKARKIAPGFPSALVIGGDQSAEIDGEFLTKPGSRQNAVAQLAKLQGREVRFISGLCVLDSQRMHAETAVVECTVKFRKLSSRQIERYIDFDKPLQAAGSFRAESAGIALFEYINSSDPSAITGMPLITLVSLLESHAYRLFV